MDVDDKENADDDIYNVDAIHAARLQVRSGTITTLKDFNTSVGRTTRQLCAAALGRVSTYTELEQRIRRNMEMRVLRRMEKFFKEDCVFYLHGGAVTPAVSNALAGAVIGLPAPPFTSGIVQAVTPVNETPAAVVGAPGSASALGTGRAVGPFTAVAGATSSGQQGASSTETETVTSVFRIRTGQGMDGPLADNGFSATGPALSSSQNPAPNSDPRFFPRDVCLGTAINALVKSRSDVENMAVLVKNSGSDVFLVTVEQTSTSDTVAFTLDGSMQLTTFVASLHNGRRGMGFHRPAEEEATLNGPSTCE